MAHKDKPKNSWKLKKERPAETIANPRQQQLFSEALRGHTPKTWTKEELKEQRRQRRIDLNQDIEDDDDDDDE